MKKDKKKSLPPWRKEEEETYRSRTAVLSLGILAAVILLLYLAGIKLIGGTAGIVLILTASAVLLELLAVEVLSLGYASPSLPLYLTSLIILGNPSLTVAIALISLTVLTIVRNRQPSWHRIFDLSSGIFIIMAVSFAFSRLHGSQDTIAPGILVPLAGALIVYALLFYGTGLLAKGLLEEDQGKAWLATRGKLIALNLLAAPLSLLTASFYLICAAIPWSILVMLPPLLALRPALDFLTRSHILKNQVEREALIQDLDKRLQTEEGLNRLLNKDLKQKVDELTIFYEMNQQFSGRFNHEKAYDIMLSIIRKLIDYDSCIILSVEKEKPSLRRIISPYRETFVLSRLLECPDEPLTKVLEGKEPLLIAEVGDDELSRRFFRDEKSIMCIPLVVRNDLVGIIYVGTKKEGNYNAESFHKLTTLGYFAANALFISQLSEHGRPAENPHPRGAS
ncbi:MAG: GAF domain-containing protein [Candidatus Eremiobacteraeota bacterium]|nr:GAF domain-containing protein [Candidatus Eremiobacteraeota bacterium]